MALDWLRSGLRGGRLREIDYHFAATVAARAHLETGQVALAAALALIELGRGNTCVALDDATPPAVADLPATHAGLRAALQREPGVCASGAAAANGAATPLVLDGERLYLRRYWQGERTVAARLCALARMPRPVTPAAAASLGPLFGDTAAGQRQACETALAHALGIISGGPGTGKTTTVTRLLLALLADAAARDCRLDIRLAAPTGKAAARMGEAIAREVAGLRAQGLASDALLAQLPASGQTLHRLLGAMPGRGFRHGRDNPLAADVVVLDESSMIDLRLLEQLLLALPAAARLVLLGDGDQLAAVEAGSVFGALCRAPTQGAIGRARAHLLQSYRFGEHSAIGRLARAINGADAETVEALLATPGAELERIACGPTPGADTLDRLLEGFMPLLAAARTGDDQAALTRALDACRVLCAVREGPFGVNGLNAAMEQRLRQRGLADTRQRFYCGRPLLVTRNDHALRLYNGDLGVVIGTDADEPLVFFPAGGGEARVLPAARLPAHETAWAMTVHKAQGSEFDVISLVLPPTIEGSALAGGRELAYTAITRARRRVELVLPPGPLDPRWLQSAARQSGLDGLLDQA